MATLCNMRDACSIVTGGLIAGAGMVIALIGGLCAVFPWNIALIVVGALITFGGAKLYLKGF